MAAHTQKKNIKLKVKQKCNLVCGSKTVIIWCVEYSG